MEHTQDILNLGTYGVDRIKLHFKLDTTSILPHEFLRNLLGRNDSKGYLQRPGNWIHINFYTLPGELYIEFNPSDWSFQADQLRLCPFDLVQPISKLVIEEVFSIGDPEARAMFQVNQFTGEVIDYFPIDWASQVTISEINFARDFTITNPEFSIKQLENYYPKYSRKSVRYSDCKTGELETLDGKRSPNKVNHTFYNKRKKEESAKVISKKDFSENTFRYEIKIPLTKIKEFDILTLDKINETTGGAILHQAWKDSNYHLPLISEASAIRLIKDNFPPKIANEYIGFANSCHARVANSGYSHREEKRIKAELRNLGLKTSKQLSLQGPSYGYLDFMTGDVVAA